MGVKKLKQFIKQYAPDAIESYKFTEIKNKYLAVDASLIIYQIAIGIRNKHHNDVVDESILISVALFYKILSYLSNNVIPVFIFDGKQPHIKTYTNEQRNLKKQKAEQELNNQSNNEKINEEKKISLYKKTFGLTTKIIRSIQKLLDLMGLPWVQAPEEADSQCAILAQSKDSKIYGTVSEDTDILTFGCPYIFYEYSKKRNIKCINLETLLKKLNYTQDEFIDICILLGTDYSQSIKGFGPVQIYKTYEKYKNELIDIQNYLFDIIISYIIKYNFVNLTLNVEDLKEEKALIKNLNKESIKKLQEKFKNTNNIEKKIILKILQNKNIINIKYIENFKKIIIFLLLIENNNKYSKIFKLFIDQSQKYLLKTNKINNQLRKLLLKNNLLDLSQLIIPYLIEMISIDNKYTIPKDYIKTWSITKEYYNNAIIIDPKLIDLQLKKPELNKLIKFLELSITQEKNYKNIINNVNKFIQYYNNIKNNN
tara:strand:+ start:169 stop:1617 length:1449 start_codon:yes stop_codon:yes gene_type:complete